MLCVLRLVPGTLRAAGRESMSAAPESAPWRTDSDSLMSTQGATVSLAADELIVELWRSFGLQLTERTFLKWCLQTAWGRR
jgi:hypothetical protein